MVTCLDTGRRCFDNLQCDCSKLITSRCQLIHNAYAVILTAVPTGHFTCIKLSHLLACRIVGLQQSSLQRRLGQTLI